jgi:ElaB/YqjD/DUF883 family membrane-anchored ribosome-binding protein
VFSTIYKLKEDLQEQITENEKYLGDVSKSLDKEIQEVRTLATDTMKQSNKEILDKFSGQFEEVNTFMHEKIEQMENS